MPYNTVQRMVSPLPWLKPASKLLSDWSAHGRPVDGSRLETSCVGLKAAKFGNAFRRSTPPLRMKSAARVLLVPSRASLANTFTLLIAPLMLPESSAEYDCVLFT